MTALAMGDQPPPDPPTGYSGLPRDAPEPHPPSWWTRHVGYEVPTVTLTEDNWTHVLAHHSHGTGVPGKIEFPDGFDIQRAVTAVMAAPQQVLRNGDRIIRYGLVDRVVVRVDTRPVGELLLFRAGYAVSGDGVVDNGRDGSVSSCPP